MVVGVVKQLAKRHGVTKHIGKIRDGVSKVNSAISEVEKVGNQIAAIPGVGQKIEKFYLDKGGREAYKKVKQGQRVMNQVDQNALR